MKSYLPGMICRRFRHGKMVTVRGGNVYPLTPVTLRRIGGDRCLRGRRASAAMSCLEERIIEHFQPDTRDPDRDPAA